VEKENLFMCKENIYEKLYVETRIFIITEATHTESTMSGKCLPCKYTPVCGFQQLRERGQLGLVVSGCVSSGG
jgi:hypothetical protein